MAPNRLKCDACSGALIPISMCGAARRRCKEPPQSQEEPGDNAAARFKTLDMRARS